MEISELQRLADQARTLNRVDPATLSLATGAMQAFRGFDERLLPSVADAFIGIKTLKLMDTTAIAEAATKMQTSMAITSAPQISEALANINRRTLQSFADAVAPIKTAQQFGFMKTLPDVKIEPSVIAAVRAFNLPPALSEALDDVPAVSFASAAEYTEEAAADAVALAEVEDVAQIIDEALDRMDKDDTARHRIVATEVAAAISAFLILAGIFYSVGQFKAAGAAIGCIATLVRVYWRVTGKLD